SPWSPRTAWSSRSTSKRPASSKFRAANTRRSRSKPMKSIAKRRFLAAAAALVLAITAFPNPTARAAAGGEKSITAAELKTWLTVISSDEFEGRATFSEGLGLAASYIAGELRAMGVKPGGDHGSYFQRVNVVGVKSTSRHSVTVTVNGQSRTFKDGEGITIPKNAGGKQ